MGEDKIISEFNESMFQIQRLHNIWLDCETLSRKGNFSDWNWKLNSAKKELNWDAKELDNKEDSNYLNKLEELDKQIFLALIKRLRGTLYKLLTEKEMLLRTIQQECGKGARYKSAEEDDWD